MTSRLATRLIALEHQPGEHSDTIWKFAALNDVEISRTPISDKLALELALFLDGDAATKFASLLPSLHSLRCVLASRDLAAFRKGAAQNPHVDDALLAELVASGGDASKLATARQQRRQAFDDALTAGVKEDIAFCYEALSLDTDAQAVSSRITNHREQILPLIGSDRRYPYRGLVLSALDLPAWDEVCADLVGAFDETFAAQLIDENLAAWLTRQQSTRAAASYEELLNDRQKLKSFTGRLTDAAMYWVMNSEPLGSAVMSAVSRRSASRPHVQANALDRSMLSTLRLTGMNSDELSALIFSSDVALDLDELVNELAGVEPLRIAMFLAGKTNRHPKTGETDALLAARDLQQQEEIARALDSEIKDLPWYPELLVGIPRSFVPVDDQRSSRIMDTFLSEELGTNVKAWEIVLSMSEEWEGSLRALTNAARQL